MPSPEVSINLVAPSSLADFTRPGLILPELRARDTAGIIGELSQSLQREGVMADVLPFYHAALNQELLGNSVLESGIALPHARVGGVKRLQFAFGRLPDPVPWGAKGSGLAEMIFLLAVPATDAARYLHLLASLARLGQAPERIAELRAAPTAEAVFRILKKIRIRTG